jgi:hypothetical protein
MKLARVAASGNFTGLSSATKRYVFIKFLNEAELDSKIAPG